MILQFQARKAIISLLWNTERRLSRDPTKAAIYNSELRKLVDGGSVHSIHLEGTMLEGKSLYFTHHLVERNVKHHSVQLLYWLNWPVLGASIFGFWFRECAITISSHIKEMFHHQVHLSLRKPPAQWQVYIQRTPKVTSKSLWVLPITPVQITSFPEETAVWDQTWTRSCISDATPLPVASQTGSLSLTLIWWRDILPAPVVLHSSHPMTWIWIPRIMTLKYVTRFQNKTSGSSAIHSGFCVPHGRIQNYQHHCFESQS